jgi:hypothetical protein
MFQRELRRGKPCSNPCRLVAQTWASLSEKKAIRGGILSQGETCCDSHFKSITPVFRLKIDRRKEREAERTVGKFSK